MRLIETLNAVGWSALNPHVKTIVPYLLPTLYVRSATGTTEAAQSNRNRQSLELLHCEMLYDLSEHVTM